MMLTYIPSNHFDKVFKDCLDCGFNILLDVLQKSFKTALPENSKDNSLPMPKIIPIIKKQFNTILDLEEEITDTSEPIKTNQFAGPICGMKEVADYSYYIFSSSYDE